MGRLSAETTCQEGTSERYFAFGLVCFWDCMIADLISIHDHATQRGRDIDDLLAGGLELAIINW